MTQKLVGIGVPAGWVAVAVGVPTVLVGVDVSVRVWVAVGVGVAVTTVPVAVGVRVGVHVTVAVAVLVGVLVAVAVAVAVPAAFNSTCKSAPMTVQVGASGPVVVAMIPFTVSVMVSPGSAPSSAGVLPSSR